MKLQLLTDIHLEFGQLQPFPKKVGDVLLLAGDILVAKHLWVTRTDPQARRARKKYDKFFAEFAAQFDTVYAIAGNHEFYAGEWYSTQDTLREYYEARGVTYLEKETVMLEPGKVLFGATFWTDFMDDDWFLKQKAKNYMTDYGAITIDKRQLTPHDVWIDNFCARDALKVAIDNNRNKQIIVMTHHGLVMPPQAGPSMTFDEFDYLFFNKNVDLLPPITHAFHGHTHDTYDYTINDGIRIVANPRGYHGYSINPQFNPEKVIEI